MMITRSMTFFFGTASAVLLSSGTAHALTTFDNGLSDTIVDYALNDYIRVRDSSVGSPTRVTFNTGANITGTDSADDTVWTEDSSEVVINDGFFEDDVSAYNQSSIFINGGILDDDVYAEGSSTITITGGSVADDVEATQGSAIYISGGSIGEDIEASNNATVDISGGELAANGVIHLDYGLAVDGNGLIILRGLSFSVNGSPVSSGFLAEVSGTISGTLADGSAFTNLPFDRNPFDDGGGPGSIQIDVIPEPGSLALLLGLGGVVLLRRWNRHGEHDAEALN